MNLPMQTVLHEWTVHKNCCVNFLLISSRLFFLLTRKYSQLLPPQTLKMIVSTPLEISENVILKLVACYAPAPRSVNLSWYLLLYQNLDVLILSSWSQV